MITRRALAGVSVVLAALLGGCRQDMHDQPRYEPLEATSFFADGRASRPPVEGTVPRGHLHEDDHLYRGKENGQWATRFPFAVTSEVLDRGRNRYEIFCTPCHGLLGDGKGMVVRRGFPPAASFHDERLRGEKPGYLFDVITNGFGRMSGYGAQLHAEDRWAVVAYIRALQLSQNVPSTTLDPADIRHLDAEEGP